VVVSALQKMPGVFCQAPQGAFYLIVKLPIDSSENFIKWLLTDFSYQGKSLLLTPTAEFYMTPGKGINEVRIAYVLNTTKLKEAKVVLQKALEQYRKRR
jgi:aspartate aminotransferase